MADASTTVVVKCVLSKSSQENGTKRKRADQIWIGTVTSSVNPKTGSLAATYVKTYGIVNSAKLQSNTQRYTEGKQKRNAVEQAVQVMYTDARNKVLKSGYAVDLVEEQDADTTEFLQRLTQQGSQLVTATAVHSGGGDVPCVMLAQKYEDRIDEFTANTVLPGRYDFYVMPKLDGIFCLAHLATGKLYSRSRKPMSKLLAYISDAVQAINIDSPGVEWIVGELYCHGMTFQEITSLVRTSEASSHADATAQTLRDKISFHVFDVIADLPFTERRKLLETSGITVAVPIQLVHAEKVQGDIKANLSELHKKYTQGLGYEGVMVHVVPTSPTECVPYLQDTRSKWLLKYKLFLQEEFLCVELKPQEHNKIVAGSAILRLPGSEKTFSATIAMPADTKQTLWANRHLYTESCGVIATVTFFSYTDGGVPRFPQLKGFRHPDDM